MIDPRHLYTIHRCDRANRLGGGVLALIPGQYKTSDHSLSDYQRALFDSCGCELVCFDAQLSLSSFRFILLYRPPNTSCLNKSDLLLKIQQLKLLIESLTHPHYTTVILGDFNLPHINWYVNDFIHDGINDVIFNCFNSLGFYQFVNIATHSSKQTDNILDIILSNDISCINVDSVSAPIGSSDHSIVNFHIVVTPNSVNDANYCDSMPRADPIGLPVYDWSAADYQSINNILEQIDWHILFGHFLMLMFYGNSLKTLSGLPSNFTFHENLFPTAKSTAHEYTPNISAFF